MMVYDTQITIVFMGVINQFIVNYGWNDGTIWLVVQ